MSYVKPELPEPIPKHHHYTSIQALSNEVFSSEYFTILSNGLVLGSWIIPVGHWIVQEGDKFFAFSEEEYAERYSKPDYVVNKGYPEWITQAVVKGLITPTEHGFLRINATGQIVKEGDKIIPTGNKFVILYKEKP